MKYTKEWRERKGLSQIELAKLCGVSVRTVQNWDAGGNVPGINLYKLEAIDRDGVPSKNSEGDSAADSLEGAEPTPGANLLAVELAAMRRTVEDQLARKDDQIDKLLALLAQK